MSPAKFAQEERVAHAKRWLTETDLPLRTISQRLHFSSEFYFMRAFKRSTGKSPGCWRKDIRKSAR
jgi:AraC-like DNA-binding protein